MSAPEPFFGMPTKIVSTARPGPDRDFELRLIAMLRGHDGREDAAIQSYRKLAESSPEPGVRYLARLIVEDEERHHRVIGEMLNQVEAILAEAPVEPSVPYLTKTTDKALAAETRKLLAFEKADSAELRRLQKELRHMSDSSLLPLLVRMLQLDTAKHIEILKYVKARVKAS